MSAYSSLIIADGATHYFILGASMADQVGAVVCSAFSATQITGWVAGDDASAFSKATTSRCQLSTLSIVATGNYSVECWVCYAYSSSTVHMLMAAGNFQIYINAGQPSFYNGSSGYGLGGVVLPYQWHHLVVTLSGTSMIAYIDGVGQTPVTIVSATRTGSAFLYASDGSSSANSLLGAMQHVAMYATVLTPAQVKAHYETGNKKINRPTSGQAWPRGRY